jgi:hypothetical protein
MSDRDITPETNFSLRPTPKSSLNARAFLQLFLASVGDAEHARLALMGVEVVEDRDATSAVLRASMDLNQAQNQTIDRERKRSETAEHQLRVEREDNARLRVEIEQLRGRP